MSPNPSLTSLAASLSLLVSLTGCGAVAPLPSDPADLSLDRGHGVPLGGERVATTARVAAGEPHAGEPLVRHELPAMRGREAIVELRVPGLSAACVPLRRLGPGDSGRGVYVKIEGRWRCIGLYLGRRWPKGREDQAVNVFAHPLPDWLGARERDFLQP
ncbi:MAG TPA: hypothetical protein DEA08_15320 [Planctomycetes bacterium]|nr:hypothetical protein [Planctomycetota bacterium]